MAKKASLNLEVDVVNNTSSGLKEVEESVNEVADNISNAAKKPTKNWGGIGELFSSLLPRGMQKTIRQFKSTQRSVGRLSKGFKVLRGAMAGIVTGGILIGLETIISNFDSIKEFFGFMDVEQQKQNEHNKETEKQSIATRTELERHLLVVQDINSAEDDRQHSLKVLASQLTELRDLDLESADAQDQILTAYDDLIRKQKLVADNKLAEAKVTEHLTKLSKEDNLLTEQQLADLDEQSEYWSAEVLAKNKAKMVAEARAKVEGELNAIYAEQNTRSKEIADIDQRREATIKTTTDAIKEQADAEANAKKTKSEIDREREANAKYLADLEKRLSEEILLAGIEDEQKRQLKVLELRNTEQKKKAEDAGANAAQLLQIEKTYQLERDAVIKEFSDRQNEEDEIARQEAEDRAMEQALLFEELETARMSERDQRLLAAADEYTKQQELAAGNADLLLLIEEDYANKRKQIEEDTNEQIFISREEGVNKLVKGSRAMFASLERAAEDGSNAQKALAITDILLQQGVAMANAVAGATKAASAAGPGAPFALAGYIATMVGAVVSSFVGIKGILAEADADTGGIGGGTVTATRPLIPTSVARTETAGAQNIQSFVVQSELQGASLINDNLYGQTSLNPG